MVILRGTSILEGQKKDNGMMCSITLYKVMILDGIGFKTTKPVKTYVIC
jgi:hypothetical protein